MGSSQTSNYRPLNELYILQPAGVAGSCDPMLSILEKSYGEGLAMAQLAVDAIDAVTYGQASNWVRTSKNIRKAKILQALFNIRAAGKLKPISAEDSASLLKVRQVFATMITTANLNSNGLFRLYCGDDYFTHYNPADADPSYPGKNVIQNPRLAMYGGWYDKLGNDWVPSKDQMNSARMFSVKIESTLSFIPISGPSRGARFQETISF